MYQSLRSSGKLSYAVVEKMFEDHQAKWPEAIFNEDSWFKYLEPLIKDNDGTYLAMLQGSKAEQRKWWLYNRFRYIDSKYNAGDALTDQIELRIFERDDITITPYADIYACVKFGANAIPKLARATRNVPITISMPEDANPNELETYIYSASQLKDVGDLSGLKVQRANFSQATRLQAVRLGSAREGYENANLGSGSNPLVFGNNTLLKLIDCRNCTALGTGTQKVVDISNCVNIEEAYFDGTKITGLTLPNGGILKKLHLPSTTQNLTIRNQKSINEFVLPSFDNISTLWLENNSSVIDSEAIFNAIPTEMHPRVRLIGFTWECADSAEIEAILDRLDEMRGLDENGLNTETAQVSGTIHTASLTGAQISAYNARYPYITFDADVITSVITYRTWDDTATLYTETVSKGENGTKVNSSTRENSADGHYSYTANGWSLTAGGAANANALTNVVSDRTVYAAFTAVVRNYTVIWKDSNGTVLETDTNVPWGTVPTYNGSTPTQDGQSATGWTPSVAAITGDTTYIATYKPMYTIIFKTGSEDGNTTLQSSKWVEDSIPTYNGATPTTTQGTSEEFEFIGWTPAITAATANATYTAVFLDKRAKTIQYLLKALSVYESNSNNKLAAYGLYKQTKLDTVTVPATTIEANAFADSNNITEVDFTSTDAITLPASIFANKSKLESVIIRSTSMSVLANVNAFTGTKIAAYDGAIYVPSALVDTYKADNVWKNFFITSIDEYPLSQSPQVALWEEINTASQNGTYTDYAIGKTVLLTMGNYTATMELVAKDADDLADESGKAHMTWISKDILFNSKMNNSNTTNGGYPGSLMYTTIANLKSSIDSTIQGYMKPVTKTWSDYSTGSKVVNSSTETFWIPSHREIFNSSSYEDSGAAYSSKFTSSSNKKKNLNGSASYWWLRSADSTTAFGCVGNGGGDSVNGASFSFGVVPGFCI